MKRKPTFHEKQIRFFTLFFGVVLVFISIGLIWLINHLTPARH